MCFFKKLDRISRPKEVRWILQLLMLVTLLAPGVGGAGTLPPVERHMSNLVPSKGQNKRLQQNPRCDFQRGWTRDVRGGLGGKIIKVTTLNSDGPGSISEALSASGMRTVVFEVGGIIDLNNRTLTVTEPFLTIAGQTAPDPGITITNGQLEIATHDVVVQHLRVRPGQGTHGRGWDPDAINVEAAYRVVIDHCSLTWGIDENLSASGPRFGGKTPLAWRRNTAHSITFSNNIIAEGLNSSTHPLGSHSKGTLVHDNVTDILIYANLYANNAKRNPLLKGGTRGVVANNYIFNPGRDAVTYALIAGEWRGREIQAGIFSIVGNVYREGPDTTGKHRSFFKVVNGPLVVYLGDNDARNIKGTAVKPILVMGPNPVVELDTYPIWPPGFDVMPAVEVPALIRDEVGARPWQRDRIDKRIVEGALSGKGKIINNEREVGGLERQEPVSASFNSQEWDACFRRKR